MNQEFKQMIEKWNEYGKNQLAEADAFLESEMLDYSRQDYLERNEGLVKEKVDYMIVSVGDSWIPIFLNISLLKPNKILFLYTSRSEDTLNKIVDVCQLNASEYYREMVDKEDAINIYGIIRDVYEKWNEPSNVYIDITGGTKVMSAACATVGYVINGKIVYVAAERSAKLPRTIPGTERLTYIEDPMEVFGYLEIEKANGLMRKYNFAGANEIYERLVTVVPDPDAQQEIRFWTLLTDAYAKWDAMDFPGASAAIGELNRQLLRYERKFKNHPLEKKKDILGEQEKVLKLLATLNEDVSKKNRVLLPANLENTEFICALVFSVFLNAETREALQKYDIAALLLYRVLEMIGQRRLITHGLYASDMQYEKMMPPADMSERERMEFENNRVNWLKQKIEMFRKKQNSPNNQNDEETGAYEPRKKVELIPAYYILAALKDPLVMKNKRKPHQLLNAMMDKVDLRNYSVFVHGYNVIKEDEYRKFKEFVEEILKTFAEVEEVDFEAIKSICSWVI